MRILLDYFDLSRANEVTGANAGGPHQLEGRTLWAARIAQFRR